jgi:hypothetical protein
VVSFDQSVELEGERSNYLEEDLQRLNDLLEVE